MARGKDSLGWGGSGLMGDAGVKLRKALDVIEAKSSAQVRVVVYDHAVLGGTVGIKNLTTSGVAIKVPDNAIVTRAWLEGVTTLTSAGAATVALGTSEAGKGDALLVATAFGDGQFAGTAVTTLAINGGVGYKVNNATGANITLTIAGAALTAGKLQVHVEYIQGV